jgi:hypothetical protein
MVFASSSSYRPTAPFTHYRQSSRHILRGGYLIPESVAEFPATTLRRARRQHFWGNLERISENVLSYIMLFFK